MFIITMLLAVRGYDIIPITFDRLPLDLLEDVDYLRDMAWFNRDQGKDMIERFSGSSDLAVEPERSEWVESMTFLFEKEVWPLSWIDLCPWFYPLCLLSMLSLALLR